MKIFKIYYYKKITYFLNLQNLNVLFFYLKLGLSTFKPTYMLL